LLNLSDCFAKKSEGFVLESLCVTRAETQRSESDGLNEDLLLAVEGKKKSTKKASNAKGSATEKGKKTQKKEKKQTTKGKAKENKQTQDNSFLSDQSP